MPSMQAQINDLLTYANKIDARVGELDVAFTARVLTLEAKAEAFEAKQKLQGAQTQFLRDQLKAKSAKIEGLETQQAFQTAQIEQLQSQMEMIIARMQQAPASPVAGPVIIQDAIELPKYSGRCFEEQARRTCKDENCPWLHQVQIDAFSEDTIAAVPKNRAELKSRAREGA